MSLWEAFREPEHIKVSHLICWVVACFALIGLACKIPLSNNPEFTFKGKPYVVCGLQGAGYTKEHKSPVYTLVVIAKEDTKKWTKESGFSKTARNWHLGFMEKYIIN